MSAQSEVVPLSRVKFVQDRQRFYGHMAHEVTSADLERFAKEAEEVAHGQSREMTDYLKAENVGALTTHAAHVRTLSAHIILLRDGLVPALRIDSDNPTIRNQAVSVMFYIKAEFDAMTLLII